MQTTFRNLILLEYGKPLPDNLRSENGLYPVYGANGVKDRSNEYLYDCPTLIIGRKGSAGEINLSEDKFWPLDVTYFVKFDVKILDLHYLYYLLRKQNLPLLAKGVKPGLNREDVYNISVAIPSLDQQKRIAERLDKVQELIALQKEQLKKLDDLIKSRFIDIFGNPITSKRFSRNTLRNCGTWQTGGTPSRQHHEYFGGKLPWITTIALENIYVGKNDAVDYISDIGLQNSTTKLIPEDSLLFAIRVGVGKVSINTCKICTNQDIVSLSLNPSRKYSLIYLYFMFRLCENYFIARTRGATIKGITVDTIKDFPIIDAPYALQTQFADFVTKIESQKGLLATRLSHLETLYKSLMQEYFG